MSVRRKFIDIRAAKGNFFDSKGVIRAVDEATRKVLSRFGAFVMTRARSSMPRRKGPSKPGRPPHAHMGLIKRYLFFKYHKDTKSVYIGPEKLGGVVGDPDTMPVLESGGKTTVRGRGRGRKKGRRRVTVAARPFMLPAYEKELQALPPNWRDTIR